MKYSTVFGCAYELSKLVFSVNDLAHPLSCSDSHPRLPP